MSKKIKAEILIEGKRYHICHKKDIEVDLYGFYVGEGVSGYLIFAIKTGLRLIISESAIKDYNIIETEH